MTPMILRPKQQQTVEMILRDKSHLSGSLGGFGKTVVGVEAVLRSAAGVTLVICPLKVIRNWQKTFANQGYSEPLKRIDSTKQGKLNFLDILEGVKGVYIIGWEMFRTMHWGQAKIDFAIADEIHRACNRSTATADMLHTVRATYKVGFSGTPAGNKTEGLWSVCHWLWPELYPHFWPWVGANFYKSMVQVGRDRFGRPKQVMEITEEHEPGRVWAAIPSKTRFTSEQKNKVIRTDIEVELSPAQMKVYREFEKDAFVWLDENPMFEELPAVKHMRLLQMTLGVPMVEYDEDGEPIINFAEDCKSAKLDTTLELLSDMYAGGPIPVIIYCHSRKFVEQVMVPRLRKKGYRAVSFVGGQTAEETNHKIEGFGVDHDIIVATIGSVGEGVDGLQDVCSTEIWLSLDGNRLLNRQAGWRLDRTGQKADHIRRFYLTAVNTVELDKRDKIRTNDELLDDSLDREMEVAI